MVIPLFIIILSIPIPAAISILILSFYKTTTSSHSSSVYGPTSYPLIGCLVSFYKNRRRLVHWYTHLLSLSPSQTILVNRLGARRTIVTANPANVEHILKSNFNNYPKGKPFTEILGDLLGFGIFNVDGELWNTQRKLASHEFSAKSLREFVVKTLEDEVHNRLLPLLDAAARDDTVLDLQEILRRFAFDTICHVSLGYDPCCLDITRPVPPLATAFDTASRICAMRGAAPVYAIWKAKRALMAGTERTLKESVRLVHDSVDEIISSKRRSLLQNGGGGGSKVGGDLLSKLLLAGHGDEVVRDMVVSFLLAGRDTTSAAMTWLFWLLTRHDNVKNELLNEIMESKGEGVEYDDLKDMKYMKACLCESMRLYPPVVWDSKHAAGDDVLPDGTPVFRGDRVTYFPYGMGRMEELWGKDRFEFKPERWFNGPGRVMKMVSAYKFPVFQAGPRVCLGKEMAFIQMKYVVSSVMRRFDFRPVSLNEPDFVPLLTAHMAGGFKVRVSKRE